MLCLNVKETADKFATRIMAGEKTVETRTLRAFSDLVGAGLHVGDIVGIVSGSRLLGTCAVKGFTLYGTESEFYADGERHLVKAGSEFSYDSRKGKVGIVLDSPVVEHDPVALPKMNHPCGYRII